VQGRRSKGGLENAEVAEKGWWENHLSGQLATPKQAVSQRGSWYEKQKKNRGEFFLSQPPHLTPFFGLFLTRFLAPFYPFFLLLAYTPHKMAAKTGSNL